MRVLTQLERSSRDTRDLNPYGRKQMDGRSCKRREREHDNKGRKGKRDLRNNFTEDSSISQAMLETAQECVEAMNNEVTGLHVTFARTS